MLNFNIVQTDAVLSSSLHKVFDENVSESSVYLTNIAINSADTARASLREAKSAQLRFQLLPESVCKRQVSLIGYIPSQLKSSTPYVSQHKLRFYVTFSLFPPGPQAERSSDRSERPS